MAKDLPGTATDSTSEIGKIITDGWDRGGLFPGKYDFDISSGGEDDGSDWVRVAGNGETIGI
ncbi:hypothetical protein [Levilactobacillus spicheri]|uniref:Uncharacterized protein n=1 Tax=Levilactobacillus spicheri TaxID=216463 RepID=A0A0F3RVH3_9LACO|nr:hypothetical protein [Levilactobacillus spicheri]KJW13991.1 hypothetical protein VC81_00525 [Levilactobacillus spicheri]